MLGVTPEMARLAWPAGTRLLAVDREAAMIQGVWPGFPGPGEGALLADWLTVELPSSSRDRVVSDGCFGVVAWTADARTLLERVRAVLRPEGRFGFRVFLKPDDAESPVEVYEAASQGRIGNFHAFKLRLLMAHQRDLAHGVCIGELWEAWSASSGARAVAGSGWPTEQIATIDAYRGQATRYWFPTMAELQAAIADAGLDVERVHWPSYELGERCPTLILAHR